MMSPSLPFVPWHMWGTTVQMSPVYRPAAAPQEQIQASQQILRINYKRPDTWSFWLGAKIVGGTISAVATNVRCLVHLNIGLGRSSFETKQDPYDIGQFGFHVFNWVIGPGAQPGSTNNNTKYTTVVRSPPNQDDMPPDDTRFLIDRFPAQDIQCWADASVMAADVGTRIDLEVSAYFAPMTHVRPDWFNEENQFPGAETGGT